MPRPTSTRPLDLALYEYLGQLFGAAIRTRVFMDLDLPSIVWKQLVQQPITEQDVLAIDVLSFKIIGRVAFMWHVITGQCFLLFEEGLS